MYDQKLLILYRGTSKLYFFFLQNDQHNERKSKIKYIQQCPNWYFVTKKGNVKTIVNKITKQNNLVKSVTGDEKHY